MIESSEISAVGKFLKTHALKGELNALLEIDSDFFVEGNAAIVETDGIFVPYFASSVRPKGATTFLIKLDGVDSEEMAKAFVNKIIYGLKSELAPFYDMDESELKDNDDLVGYAVIDKETGQEIGKVESIDDSTANLLFILSTPEGETIYVPAVEEFICEVDDEAGKIIMQLPEGLVDLNEKKK